MSAFSRIAFALALGWATLFGAAPLAAGELRVGVQYGLAYLPFYVAQDKRLWDKHLAAEHVADTRIEFAQFSGSTALNDAILSQSIDLAVYGSTGLLIAWDKTHGTPLEVVGLCGVTIAPLAMAGRERIQTLDDLKPEDRITIPAMISPSAYLLRMAAEKRYGRGNGNKLDGLIVSMASPDGVSAVLSGTEVTSFFGAQPFTTYIARQPGMHIIMTQNDIFGEPTDSFLLGVSKRYAAANPGLMRAIIATMDEANAFIAANPQETTAIYLRHEPSKVFDASFIEELLRNPQNAYTTDVSGTMQYADYLHRNKQMKTVPASWKDMFLPYIYDRTGS